MAESKIRNDNFYQVTGWMLNELGLKGTALQVYAIIYGFTQDEESTFKGSLQYLMDFTNASKPTVIKALNDLVELGYILKTENTTNGIKFNEYKVSLPVVKKLDQGSKETLPGVVKKLYRGSKETLPNNKLDNKDIDNKSDNKGKAPAADYSKTNFSPEMISKVEEWLRYKQERREEYKPTGRQNLIAQIQNNVNQYGEVAVMTLIGECMAANYQGIIFDRLKKATGGRREPVPAWMGKTPDERLKQDMEWLANFSEQEKKTAGNDPGVAFRASQLQQKLQGGRP